MADVRNIIQKCLCITDFLIFSDSFPTSAKDSYDNFNPQYSDLQDFDTFQSHNRPWKAKLIQKYLAQQNLSSLEEFASLNKDLEDLAKICFDEDRETKIPNLNLGKVPDFEQEVFDRIQAGLKICKENAINNPQAPIHQTVETSVKEGVQSLEGLGNWVLKSTEALQKTGGEALEKHAITSRWIAGSVAAVTLLVGSGVAYTISKFKPEKPVTSNTR